MAVIDVMSPFAPDAAALRLPRAVAALATSERLDDAVSLPETAVLTKAVVASWVVLVPAEAVGAAGVPVNVGEASAAREVSVG
jgi:hypothetical protein